MGENNENTKIDWSSVLRQGEHCNECGACLAACPYIKMDRERAAREMRRLRAGRYSMVLDRCAGCAACEALCPHGCRPYALIRYRWYERYKRDKLPERARFLLPHSAPNFRSSVRLSSQDEKFIATLRRAPDGKRALFTGCNALLLPHQLRSRAVASLDVFGAFDFCCGEMYYRMGLLDHARQCALRIKELLKNSPVREMLFLCSACMNMFKNIYPNEYGVRFDFDMEFMSDELLRKLDKGEIEVKRPLRGPVAVHDSCHAKLMGGGLWESTRSLVRALGADTVECTHTREKSLCCGVAAGCCAFSPIDLGVAAARRLLEFDATGARVAAAYCNGCFLTLDTVRVAFPTRTPVVPLWDLAQTAIGDPPPAGAGRRITRQMLLGVLTNALPAALIPGRSFRPESIDSCCRKPKP